MSTPLWDLVLKPLAVSVVGLVGLLLMRRRSAAARHMVLTLTLVGMLALPILSIVLPRWQSPLATVKVSVPAPMPTESVALAAPVQTPAPAIDAINGLFILWGAVAGFLLLKMALRVVRLRGLERRLAMANDPALFANVTDHCRRTGRHVLLLEGAPNEPPMTWGHFRPVLLLPSDAGNWEEGRLDSVVLHELAHIERGDWLASVAAQIACAVYWFNPLTWVIANRLTQESESAADDRVLGQGLSASQYATHLLGVLRDLRRTQPASDAALAMARPGSLDGRVRAILEERRCRRPVRGTAAFGLLVSLGVGTAVVAAAGPTIVREVRQISPEVSVAVRRLKSETIPTPAAPRAETSPVETSSAPQKSSLVVSNGDRQVVLASHGEAPRTMVAEKKAPSVPVRPIDFKQKANQVTSQVEAPKPAPVDTAHIEKLIMSQTKAGLQAGQMEMQAGFREAQEEVRRAIEEARHDLRTSGATGVHLKIGEDAIKMGADAAERALTSIKANVKLDVQLNEKTDGAKNPKDKSTSSKKEDPPKNNP